MSNTYLTVPFKEKDSAKALGARWDGSARRWYVPAGLSLTPFAEWLPATAQASAGHELPATSSSINLQVASRGIPLSRLLQGVARVVADAFSEGVWTTAEVLRASVKNGHIYLELSERDADGRVLAKANAAIWASTAQRIVPEFERATGTILGAGIKLLVRARPVYKAQFGFTLDIDALDPTYTLGDLEAKKQDIRDRLTREQRLDLNRRLPSPWDYSAVLVIAPQGGAGLGDFAKEADRLQHFGVCRFTYLHCRFQGEGAAADIQNAIRAGLAKFAASQLPDAIILIRGGGAVNDLAWLNDYALARCLCECPIPVITGIGHERDSTVLDEVANLAFDTPSKVIAGIEQVIAQRVRDARAAFERILQHGLHHTQHMRSTIEQHDRSLKTAALATLTEAGARCDQRLAEMRLGAVSVVHRAERQAHEHFGRVSARAAAQVAQARQAVPATLNTITTEAFSALRTARLQLHSSLPAILDRAHLDLGRSRHLLQRELADVTERAHDTVHDAASRAQSLFREIAGQGPQKTLSRGFAIVRDTNGKTLTSAARTANAKTIEVIFQDGKLEAAVRHVTLETSAEVSGKPDQGNQHESTNLS